MQRSAVLLARRATILTAQPGKAPRRPFIQREINGSSALKFYSITLGLRANRYASKAKELNQKGLDEEEKSFNNQIDNAVEEAKELQARTPWHRADSTEPPVNKIRNRGSMTKGKLLTTPSRLLKLILPLTSVGEDDRKTIEPLALVVHPQQPLSYLERLIQSELPTITGKDGKEKLPEVFFRAEDSAQGKPKASTDEDEFGNEESEQDTEQGSDEQVIDGKLIKVGKIESSESIQGKEDEILERGTKERSEINLRGGHGEGGVETYSGAGREATHSSSRERKFVRWSSSTEIGDFIRDAARGKEFAVNIEGASKEIRVGVPSFNDRTHYLRVRLRKTSKKLEDLAALKKECDELAHKTAQRLAIGGFGLLVSWWAAIYHYTFQTDYGWDTMEPITYLAGLSSIIIGYLWFLYHNREVSYRAALNLTVSRRQNALYQARGFDSRRWDSLIEEANALRKEIKVVADEYDVEWDEKQDEMSEAVHQALKDERIKARKAGDEDEDEDENDEGKGSGKTNSDAKVVEKKSD